MTDIDILFNETKKYLSVIENKFLKPYIPADPNISPEEYEHDVKSYIILSYAAIEEFFEITALFVVEESIKLYLSNKLTKPLLCMLSSSDKRLQIPENEKGSDIRSFDNVRKILYEFKTVYSIKINDNHGASLKYMRKLFYPISIDIPDDLKLIGAINWIAEYRGSFAHKRTSKKMPSPEDSRNYINDCLLLCENIKNQATLLLDKEN